MLARTARHGTHARPSLPSPSLAPFPKVTYIRNGGRTAELESAMCGLVGAVFNNAERKNCSIVTMSNFVPNPKKPGEAKSVLKLPVKAKVDATLEKLFDASVKKHADAMKGLVDINIAHDTADAWRVDHYVALVKRVLTKNNVNVRHVYNSASSCLLACQFGPGLWTIALWPADEMEYPRMGK